MDGVLTMQNLFNFMPGEWEATGQSPTGWQGRMGGLLSGDDPLLNIGLGILANNNSRNLAQVLGRGVQQGLQQTQQAKAFGLQTKRQQAQDKRLDREDAEYQRKRDAVEAFKVKNPQYAEIADIDPSIAIKAANPNLSANSADPYYTLQSTPQGIGKFNVRTGEFELLTGPDGNPVIKSSDSPTLQGQIEEAKSRADGNYKIDTSIPGRVQTVTQTAEQANPLLNQPIPANVPRLPTAQPSMVVPPALQKQRDDVRLKILLAEQQADGGPGKNPELDKEIARFGPISGGGIRVPTAAELAADKKRAETAVETETDKTKNVRKSNQFLSVARQAEQILNDSKNPPTASGTGAAVDMVGNLVGYAPDGSVPAAKLEALSGWLVSNVPRMEGPQSNFDVQNYQTMAGLVGDRTKPLAVRQGALKTVIELQEKYKAQNQDGNILPNNAQMPVSATPPKAAIDLLKMNPKLRAQFDAKYGPGASDQVLGK
jgi:hypothetical protein